MSQIFLLILIMLTISLLVHFHSFTKQFLVLGIVCVASLAAVLVFDASLNQWPVVLIVFGVVCAFTVLLELPPVVMLRIRRRASGHILPMFYDKKVLILAPHQDDDINLCGGMIEQYVQAKSDVIIAFYTNGDRFEQQRYRLQEAIDVAEFYGIPEENVIFLGYGDQWLYGGKHIYNAPQDQVLTSAAGKTSTYGLGTHTAFMEGISYTRNNVVESIQTLIEKNRPDVIYCTDYDKHSDHKALSLFFEEAMGNILKKEIEYRPEIYKGFAYSTAFYAVDDFYSDNLQSTVNPYGESFMTENNVYVWEERVRIPVSKEASYPLLMFNKTFRAYEKYISQRDYILNAYGIINADKVFWHRRTDSLIYDADIECSSGNASYINDFKYIETDDITDNRSLYKCLWHPLDEDSEKTVTITLRKPKMIRYISLYDNPSVKDNVLEAEIVINQGEYTYHVSNLRKNGAETRVYLDKPTEISTFSVKLIAFEGNYYGLTEIEAYGETKCNEEVPGKITDANGNFLYQYNVPVNGEGFLKVYSSDNDSCRTYTMKTDNPACSVIPVQDGFRFMCPPKQRCVITLYEDNTNEKVILDRIEIVNRAGIQRRSFQALRLIDSLYVKLAFHEQIYYYKALWIHGLSLLRLKLRGRRSK